MTVHHFTVDVEEYYQVLALRSVAPRETWHLQPSRVVGSTLALAALLEAAGARATMFVLGCVAERHPGLVKDLADAGHEVASHGWAHRRVTSTTPQEFREAVHKSKCLLEDITGHAVLGYRAPSFSIHVGCEWALDILLEEGYRYDSSLFPIRRFGYGYAGGQRFPHWLERSRGSLAEVPPATLSVLGVNHPSGGGGYLRLLPLQLIHAAFAQAEARGLPATLYVHPWELDPDQPRFKVGPLTRLRHYGGLRRTRSRLEQLLARYRFGTIAAGLGLTPAPVEPGLGAAAKLTRSV